MFSYFERESGKLDNNCSRDLKFIKKIKEMQAKYYQEPALLMERFRTKIFDNEEDKHFAVIVHGDYYRNNVIFKDSQGEEPGAQIKMFDFQVSLLTKRP